MATIDDDLNQIERDIRTLKIEYEQFFGGGRPRPPADTQWRVDTMMRRYNERGGDLTFAQRFRFNNLAQTYAKYVDMWRKKTMQKEAATQQHHFGAAARAIEAERARAAAAKQAAEPALEPAMAAKSKGATAAHAASAFAMSFSNPEKEKDKITTLYQKLLEARTETGEKSGAPTLKDFEKFVRQKTRDLQDKGGREVEYTVSIESGRVKLKARISS
jgi:membrane-bound lytic murein transglycosylase